MVQKRIQSSVPVAQITETPKMYTKDLSQVKVSCSPNLKKLQCRTGIYTGIYTSAFCKIFEMTKKQYIYPSGKMLPTNMKCNNPLIKNSIYTNLQNKIFKNFPEQYIYPSDTDCKS